MHRKSNASSRFWKWRTQTMTKSASETEGPEDRASTPLTSIYGPLSPGGTLSGPVSPFLTESAHVLSLQNPNSVTPSGWISESLAASSATASVRTPLALPDVVIEPSVETPPPSIPVPSSPKTAKSMYNKAIARIKSRSSIQNEELSKNLGQNSKSQNHIFIEELMYEKTSRPGTWLKDGHGNFRITRKLFGRAPWHRKESRESISSVSSSVRELLMGEPPPGTPASTSTTSGINSIDSQYPAGEAVRVPTPPLAGDTADGRARGFFTSTVPPAGSGEHFDDDSVMSQTLNLEQSQCETNRRGNCPHEWWEKVPKRKISRFPSRQKKGFTFDVPEHLPTSPLCPAHPQHHGGGHGLCVYHGRGHRATMFKVEARPYQSSDSTPEGVPVAEKVDSK